MAERQRRLRSVCHAAPAKTSSCTSGHLARPLQISTDAVVDDRSCVRQAPCILHVEARLVTWMTLVVQAAIDPLDGVWRIYRVFAKCVHKKPQIRRTWEFVGEFRNPERILRSRGGGIGERLTQPAQELRRNILGVGIDLARCRLRRWSCSSYGVPLWCLLQRELVVRRIAESFFPKYQ